MKKYLLLLVAFYSFGVFGQIPFENNIYEETCNIPVVKLNDGKKDVYFLIDTGSNLSTINRSDSKYKRISTNHSHTYTVHGEVVSNVYICKITLNGVKQSIIENDINYLLDRYKKIGFNVIGILGTDFLRLRGAIIDYNKKVLILNK